MADLDHNLSLADALTEPLPSVEEEVQRDFIASLEADKFEDVVGETVDKTDYVPLLDDEDGATPGSQEPKSKGHLDGIPAEHSSASGPMVVENGDHGLQGHHTGYLPRVQRKYVFKNKTQPNFWKEIHQGCSQPKVLSMLLLAVQMVLLRCCCPVPVPGGGLALPVVALCVTSASPGSSPVCVSVTWLLANLLAALMRCWVLCSAAPW